MRADLRGSDSTRRLKGEWHWAKETSIRNLKAGTLSAIESRTTDAVEERWSVDTMEEVIRSDRWYLRAWISKVFSSLLEGDILVPQKTENHDDCRHQSSCDIWGLCWVVQSVPQNWYQNGHTCKCNEYAATVDSDTSYPFAKIISAGTKHEPLVSEKCDSNCDQAPEHSGVHIAVRAQPCEGPVQQREEAVAKNRVEAADKNVSRELQRRFVIRLFHAE